jgi:hypothetical protein
MKNFIGCDFSINKPAACIFTNNKYIFYAWPYNLKSSYIDTYKNAGVNIIDRIDTKDKGNDLSSKMIYEVQNAKYLAKLITETLKSFLNIDTYISFEGLSYGSSGDVSMQLGGYKYMLMEELSKLVPYENMFTYSPITIKSIAGCAKRGMGKAEMINSFIKVGPVCKFRLSLFEKREEFLKKGGKTWIDLCDDLVDSYFALETFREKKEV